MIYCGLHQVEVPDTFTWLHMHQTWLDGFGIEDAKTNYTYLTFEEKMQDSATVQPLFLPTVA